MISALLGSRLRGSHPSALAKHELSVMKATTTTYVLKLDRELTQDGAKLVDAVCRCFSVGG